jgi:hypothetical protein
LRAEEKVQNKHLGQLGTAIIEGGIAWAAGVANREGEDALSWIGYTMTGGEEENNERLHDGKQCFFM